MGKEEKVSRRGYVKYAAAGVVVVAVAGAGAYYATRPKPPTLTPTPTPTPSPTPTPTVSPTPTPTIAGEEIHFWHHEPPAHRVAAFQVVCDTFKKETGNEAIQHAVTWPDAWPKTLAAIKAGTTPDLQFGLTYLLMETYRAKDLIPIDEVVEEVDSLYTLFEPAKTPYYFDGHWWGVPVWAFNWVLLYRPSYLKEYVGTTEPPKSWEEFVEYARLCTDKKKGIYGAGLGPARNMLGDLTLYMCMLHYGVTVFDKNGKVNIDQPGTEKALNNLLDLWPYCPPGGITWSWGEIEMAFGAGEFAMMPYFGGLQKRFYELEYKEDMTGTFLPYPKDGTFGSPVLWEPIFIHKSAEQKGAKHLATVKDFVKFCFRPDMNVWLTAEQEPGSFNPTTKAVAESKEYWDHKYIKFYKELNQIIMETFTKPGNVLEYGVEYGPHPMAGAVVGAGQVLGTMLNMVITKEMSVEKAVEWGQQTAMELAGEK